MLTAYILILTATAWFIPYALISLWRRARPHLPATWPAPALGHIALTTTLALFIIVAAPASLLVAAIALLALAAPMPTIYKHLLTLLAPLVVALYVPTTNPWNVPPLAIMAASFLLLALYVFAARTQQHKKAGLPAGLLLALLPLIVTPLVTATPSYVALDGAILSACWLGALMAGHHTHPTSATAPFALILGWLTLTTALHGGGILALLSFITYGGWMLLSPTTPREPAHAV